MRVSNTETRVYKFSKLYLTSVFNFWEPLHYIDHGHAFQTWEVTPMYAVRSWAYVLLHLIPARLPLTLNLGKVSFRNSIAFTIPLNLPM